MCIHVVYINFIVFIFSFADTDLVFIYVYVCCRVLGCSYFTCYSLKYLKEQATKQIKSKQFLVSNTDGLWV